MRPRFSSTGQGLLRYVIAFFNIARVLSVQSASAEPAPIAVPVSTRWYGDDGNWSPVMIRVGSPEQWLSVLPNTISQETWVIGPGGCDGTFTCQDKRGGIFFSNSSTTWTDLGLYQLNFDPQFKDYGYAEYGLDKIDLNEKISVPSQVVGILNTTDFWLGSLGLGVSLVQFAGTVNHLTFLSTLVENSSLIPSHSYGYTAGAYYQLKGVPASLTLGGVDSNRFVPNPASFTLGPNAQPVVAINSITVSSSPLSTSFSRPNWQTNPLTLLDRSQATLFTIDSSTPFLWLPQSVCDAFAQALNLTYDDTLQLYTFGSNGTNPDVLADWNMSFIFNIADLPRSSNAIDIEIPYAAFDLQLSYPFPNLVANASSPGVNYFPIRRAANSTQYTIGRAFLQESYLTVDYERNNFSVSQAKFELDALTNLNLVEITRPDHSNFTGPAGTANSGLSTGAKAGIGAGAGVGALAVIAVLLWFCLRRRRRKEAQKSTESSTIAGTVDEKATPEGPAFIASELLADKRQPTEIAADTSNTRFELSGTTAVEMPAGEVPVTYFAPQRKPVPGSHAMSQKNNYRDPAELETQTSSSKDFDGFASRQSLAPSLPAYSPSQVGRPQGDSVSPSSAQMRRGGAGPGSPSSTEPLVSPRTTSSPGGTHRQSTQVRTPISPPSEGHQSPQQTHGLSETSSRRVSASLLAAPEPEHPARSSSRSSRFREEGISNEVEEAAEQPSGPPELRRFSWEA